MKGIIIRRGNGIELVVVTTGAGNGKSQHPARDNVDTIVQAIVPITILTTYGEEAKGGQGRIVLF